MRAPAIVAGLALVLAACGGSDKKVETKDSTGGMAMNPPAAAGTGTTHEVQMVQEGTNSFKFIPADLTIKPGDVVVFKTVSGVTHDVAFWADSIPPGASDVLNAAIPDKSQDLATAMINQGDSVAVSFANAPVGRYAYYCIPHMAMGMKGSITVAQ